jgi:Alw26I/Eco31I/Esp3I family type II restriction endonuclease
MPNAVSENGKINWQVSSGKSTSFYKFYLERFDWWIKKADAYKVHGKGNSDDRFSITARLISPTGYRPCRLCGKSQNVGYFYLNHTLAQYLNRETKTSLFSKKMAIDEAIKILTGIESEAQVQERMFKIFPERSSFFKKHGFSKDAFEKSNYIRSVYLSPGFMCNPPDRLDGFHDYCHLCRATKDPGRSPENLKSYLHDRRVFELWSDGDWLVADALYNSAGPGKCYICGKKLKKISPDHVGPLACGFKQLPLFLPTCGPCNSSKNRRMFLSDIKILVDYEKSTGESVASWQVQPLWDKYKLVVKNDRDAKELSDYMRAVQDFYLRTLYSLFENGYSEFLVTILHPEYALFKVQFKGLDSSNLTFAGFTKMPINTKLRNSLSNRIIRIAFEELLVYQDKSIVDRKVRKFYVDNFSDEIDKVVVEAKRILISQSMKDWDEVMKSKVTSANREVNISKLRSTKTDSNKYSALNKKLRQVFLDLGSSTAIPLS